MIKVLTIVALLLACNSLAIAAETNAENASTNVLVVEMQDECGCLECQSTCNDCNSCSQPLEFFGPLGVINQHPSTVIFLAPIPVGATVLTEGEGSFAFKLDMANHIIRETDNGIVADYDFETVRTTVEYRQGLADGEFSASLPLVYRSHGMLDGLISEWHKWFALPNGLRTVFPDNQYRYAIISREGLVYSGEGDVLGLGDLALGYKQNIYNRNCGQSALSWRIGLKAPTGDPDDALGSGNWDFSGGLLYQKQYTRRIRGYVNVDYVVVGKPDWDNVEHQDALVTLWAAEYALNPRTTVNAQFRTHRNPLVIGSKEADKDAQELALGFNYRVNDRLVWSGGFNEDLNPETAPDFVLMSYLKWEL